MAFNVKTFYTRATTAIVFVALLLGCVWYSYVSFVLFFTVVGFIGLYEFFKLSEKLNSKPNKVFGYLSHLLGVLIAIFYNPDFKIPSHIAIIPYILVVLCFLLFIRELFRENSSLNNIAYTLLALLYVTVPCFMIISMVNSSNFFIKDTAFSHKVIGMIFFIWINDTGAYLVGSFIGKHKLWERVSPNKTWEGTMGGIILCITLSYVVYLIFPQLAYKHWLAISVIVAVFGTLGDLVESMLKRMAGVKDSGSIMPGHGGVLDRFDSLFFATPFVFCYLAIMGLL